jgi:putative Holliday junction resolvase
MAISDASATLARPAGVVRVAALDAGAVSAVRKAIADLLADDDLDGVVVGLPRRLDGTPNALTSRVEAFAAALQSSSGYPVHLQDERLTSHEAESLLARREKNWRARKEQLDAASAAIILQDFLDARRAASFPHDEAPDADY